MKGDRILNIYITSIKAMLYLITKLKQNSAFLHIIPINTHNFKTIKNSCQNQILEIAQPIYIF